MLIFGRLSFSFFCFGLSVIIKKMDGGGVLFFFMTFVFCDFISASMVKPLFHRLRPCNDSSLPFLLRHVVACGSGFSFPSSHASNHVGMAVFMMITLRNRFSWIFFPPILWAFSICFAQVYVGVHYPSDIVGGAMLGILIGMFFGRYYNRRFGSIR